MAIVIALPNNPSLLLADEPTGAVDTKTAALVLDVFKRLNRELGVTIIIVTHDVNLSKSIDRVVSIRDGKTSTEMIRKRSLSDIASLDDLSEMKDEPAGEELAVLDRAGRLQLPKEYLSALGIKGGDKVKVELEDNGIVIRTRSSTVPPPDRAE